MNSVDGGDGTRGNPSHKEFEAPEEVGMLLGMLSAACNAKWRQFSNISLDVGTTPKKLCRATDISNLNK